MHHICVPQVAHPAPKAVVAAAALGRRGRGPEADGAALLRMLLPPPLCPAASGPCPCPSVRRACRLPSLLLLNGRGMALMILLQLLSWNGRDRALIGMLLLLL